MRMLQTISIANVIPASPLMIDSRSGTARNGLNMREGKDYLQQRTSLFPTISLTVFVLPGNDYTAVAAT